MRLTDGMRERLDEGRRRREREERERWLRSHTGQARIFVK